MTPAPHARAQLADGQKYVIVQDAGRAIIAAQASGPAPSLAEQGFRRIPVPPGEDATAFAAALRADPAILSAEPDADVLAAATPNDPFYGNQAPYLAAIGAPEAWDLTTGAGERIVVAVLDSGIDTEHPDLAPRLWENPLDADGDGVDDDGNGCVDDRHGCRIVDANAACGYATSDRTGAVRDDHGIAGGSEHSHGTLVAGIIGAAGDNNMGIAGLAWNVELMAVKVLDCGPGGTGPRGKMSNVAAGIDYARRMGARIINLSLASDPGDLSADLPILRKAIEDARAQGILIVAAAGNHTPGSSQVAPGYPAAYTQYDNVIAVGASDLAGDWATFSNYGPAIDFAAPGLGIVGPTRTDLPNGGVPYGVASQGTSFATPLVSGMFALMVSRNSRLAVADYLAIAREAASPASPAPHGQNWAGSGIIDVGEAVERIPLSLTGSALADWMDVPAGTAVVAMIDGEQCGSATTTAVGPITRYAIKVASAAEHEGCGVPGATVEILLGGQPAQPTFTWGGANADIGLVNRDVSTVSPEPGAVVVQTIGGGWSNIAQLGGDGALPGALAQLTPSWTAAARWDPLKETIAGMGGYRLFGRNVPAYVNDLGIIDRYDAIWVQASPGNAAIANPDPAPGRTISLAHGWNNVVYTGANRQVEDALRSIEGHYTKVMQYDSVARAWTTHVPGRPRYENDFGALFSLKVYWIYVTEPVALRMD